MTALLLIALGGALGGMARYWISELVEARYGDRFPLGTLLVNLIGAFAIGLAAGWLPDGPPPQGGGFGPVWAALVVGGLGSFTTVSSFSLQTLTLLRSGRAGRGVLNIAVSVAGCLGAAALGLALAGGWG